MNRRELAKRVVESRWQETGRVWCFRVRGASMGSALPDGSLVRVCFCRSARLRSGSIVYLRRGERRIVHRLLWRFGPVCVERGDAERRSRLCLRSSILGVVEDWEHLPTLASYP